MSKGKIIVLEGLDGCGKSTQLDLAYNFLVDRGVHCRTVSFPNYGKITGQLIRRYLKGEIPCEGITGVYAASSMYAVDRYVSYMTDWGSFYESGGAIISGRYTTSNAIYQLTRLPRSEHDSFLKWLFDYEYVKLGLPKPDMTIFLDMPVEVSQRLLEERYLGDPAKKDILERDVSYQEECRKNALYLAGQDGWKVIDCVSGGVTKTVDDISAEVCAILETL